MKHGLLGRQDPSHSPPIQTVMPHQADLRKQSATPFLATNHYPYECLKRSQSVLCEKEQKVCPAARPQGVHFCACANLATSPFLTPVKSHQGALRFPAVQQKGNAVLWGVETSIKLKRKAEPPSLKHVEIPKGKGATIVHEYHLPGTRATAAKTTANGLGQYHESTKWLPAKKVISQQRNQCVLSYLSHLMSHHMRAN